MNEFVLKIFNMQEQPVNICQCPESVFDRLFQFIMWNITGACKKKFFTSSALPEGRDQQEPNTDEGKVI